MFKYKDIYCRENTLDKYIVNEQHIYSALNFKDKIILDVGGNIGAFARYSINQGAQKVISLEPEKENFDLLQKNAKGFNILPLNLAVVGDNIRKRNLFLNSGKNKGSHSLLIKSRKDFIEVNCINFYTLLSKYNPEIVKIDIEGGEYEVFDYNSIINKCVEMLAIEFHFGKKVWRNKVYYDVLKYIYSNNFKDIKIPKVTKNNWYTMGVFKRK